MKARLGAAVLALFLAAPALAGPSAQDRITRFTVRAQELDAADTEKQFTQELGTLRAWIGEAQAYLAQEEEELLDRALDRAAVQIRLIEALLDRAKAEAAARAAHEKADALERELAGTHEKAIELEKRKAALEEAGL